MKDKKKKLNIDELRVQSFITSLSINKSKTIKGGDTEITDQHLCTNPTPGSACEQSFGGANGTCDTSINNGFCGIGDTNNNCASNHANPCETHSWCETQGGC